jgi:hypothetical protein
MLDRDTIRWEENNAALASREAERVRGFIEAARELAERAARLQSNVSYLDNDLQAFRDTLADAIGDLSGAIQRVLDN